MAALTFGCAMKVAQALSAWWPTEGKALYSNGLQATVCESSAVRETEAMINVGDKVDIISGSFEGKEGTVISIKDDGYELSVPLVAFFANMMLKKSGVRKIQALPIRDV